jgi:predicted dithiol-disulfide oxidoreductase (DUF899 family)
MVNGEETAGHLTGDCGGARLRGQNSADSRGTVYHTYSAYARGLDGLWGAYQWLDRAPKGRNETAYWWRRRDEYDKP